MIGSDNNRIEIDKRRSKMSKLNLPSGKSVVKVWWLIAVVLLLTLTLAACSSPDATPSASPSEITVTFEGDECIYNGPESVPAGRIPILLDVRDQTAHEEYFVGVSTLDEGKTYDDLVAAPFETGLPLWVHDQGSVSADKGTSQSTTVILYEGPMYLVCLTTPPDQKTGVLGPVEIEPKSDE